jgi:hypothetical protein
MPDRRLTKNVGTTISGRHLDAAASRAIASQRRKELSMKFFNKKSAFVAALLGILFFWRKKKAGGSETS